MFKCKHVNTMFKNQFFVTAMCHVTRIRHINDFEEVIITNIIIIIIIIIKIIVELQ